MRQPQCPGQLAVQRQVRPGMALCRALVAEDRERLPGACPGGSCGFDERQGVAVEHRRGGLEDLRQPLQFGRERGTAVAARGDEHPSPGADLLAFAPHLDDSPGDAVSAPDKFDAARLQQDRHSSLHESCGGERGGQSGTPGPEVALAALPVQFGENLARDEVTAGSAHLVMGQAEEAEVRRTAAPVPPRSESLAVDGDLQDAATRHRSRSIGVVLVAQPGALEAHAQATEVLHGLGSAPDERGQEVLVERAGVTCDPTQVPGGVLRAVLEAGCRCRWLLPTQTTPPL